MAARTFKAWLLNATGQPLELRDVETPVLHPSGVLVRIESAMVLSYMQQVIDGSTPYALPPTPFIPGSNAVGQVEAVGAEVSNVAVGDRVFLSPHLVADYPANDPPQILIGLTAMGASRFGGVPDAALKLQQLWRHGTFGEFAHWPASCVTPLPGAAALPDTAWIALSTLLVPYGGLLRAGAAPGQVVLINGATGCFGSAGVMLAVAMGAARVVALGRDAEALKKLADALGSRVVPAVLRGDDPAADAARIEAAAGGKADIALDLLGRASSAASTSAALRALRRRGRLVMMGSASAPLQITFGEMLSNEWEVVGAFMYPKTAPVVLAQLIAAGALDLSPIRINRFPLAQLPQAIAAAQSMQSLELTAVGP
ncbi:MAG: zinc-binding dehydrogenase [Steroidobacteraceae bacterium]